MQLDQKQCQAFVAAIDSGSLELAAQSLRLTPSAISQRIRALEEQLGKPLLVRSRPCRATREGRLLLQHLRRTALLEADLAASFADEAQSMSSVALAVNADSIASWFLPALAPFLIRHNMLLDISIDDQDHTYRLLQEGMALGCISTEPHAMRGCRAEVLGIMRYQAMMSPDFARRWFAAGVNRDTLREAPVMIYNQKDALQADWLQQHYGLLPGHYPCHYLPASDPYLQAVRLGLGWGMLPEVQLGVASSALICLNDSLPVDVTLYWHHWQVQSPRLEQLSQTLLAAAREVLRPSSP